jgi:hypothetical protein
VNETEENERTGSPKGMSRTLKVAVGAVSLAVAAVGVAGAVGTYTNAADLVGDGFALSMVAGGEGVVAVCAMVMLLLTVLGRPSPAALRLATVAMPVVASAVGAVVAPDVTTKVIMAVGPLAMTAAAEGLCLVARNAVAVSTGTDVEADRRAMQRAASLDKHAAKDGRLSKAIVTRTRRQLVAVDPTAADLVAGALRRQVAADVTARMAAIGATVPALVVERDEQAEEAPALDPAPEQAATPDATADVAAVASEGSKADAPEAPALTLVPPTVSPTVSARADQQGNGSGNGAGNGGGNGANLRPSKQSLTDEQLDDAADELFADVPPPVSQARFIKAMRAAGHSASTARLSEAHKRWTTRQGQAAEQGAA